MRFSMSNSGKPGITASILCGDVVDDLADEFTHSSGAPAIGAIITCEDNDIRFTFGGVLGLTGVPTQLGYGHVLAAGQSLVIDNGAQIRTFQFINKTNKLNALLQVTMLFELSA